MNVFSGSLRRCFQHEGVLLHSLSAGALVRGFNLNFLSSISSSLEFEIALV
jgi:hypothetical protein